MRMVDFAAGNRLPFTWRDPETTPRRSRPSRSLPLVRLPGGAELQHPSSGDSSRARSGSAASSRRARRSTCSSSAPARRASAPRSTAPPRGSHARRRKHGARRPGRLLAPDRELPRLPRRDQRHRADEPRGLAGAQVRRAARDARTARRRSSPGTGATSSASRKVRRSTRGLSCSRPAPSTGASRSRASATTRGSSVFYAAGPPEAQLCGASRVAVVGGGNSAGQAAVWLARGGALVDPAAPPRRPPRDDVRLPGPRARALRRRGPRPQRDRRAPRRATGGSRRSR